MTDQPAISAFEIDAQAVRGKHEPSNQELLVHAARRSGRSVLEIARDQKRTEKGPGRLSLKEFVHFGMHHQGRFDDAEKRAFVNGTMHWPIVHACNDYARYSVSEDKMTAEALLRAADIPTTQTIAVYDESPRTYGPVPKVDSVGDVRDAILSHIDQGVFCKPSNAMTSTGAFRIAEADAGGLTPSNGKRMNWDAFVRDYLSGRTYLIQPRIKNDPALSAYCSALATVRTMTIVTKDGIRAPFAALKIPQGANVADNFWRDGNLVCGLDVETGRVTRIARDGGLEIEYLEDHPEIPGLMGLALPYWDELRKTVHAVGSLYAATPYHSTDIALTANGPVVIEVNHGGSFELVQIANGRGVLSEEMLAFFASHDALTKARPVNGLARKRFGLFRRRG